MFREHLNLELSETVFGHQCLSRLLADEHLNDDFQIAILDHPPGLSFEGKPKPPPGLSLPEPMCHVDLANWPTPADASKGESPVPGTSADVHGLSPEKTARKAPCTAPRKEPPPQKKTTSKTR